MTSTGGRPPLAQPRDGHSALWWIVAILCGTALFIGLLVAAVPALLVLSWSSSGSDVEKRELDWERAKTLKGEEKLRAASQDGRLTDAEITAAVERRWAIERLPQEVRVTTDYRAGEYPDPPCWVIVLTLPLGPSTRADHQPAAPCSSTSIHPPATSSP